MTDSACVHGTHHSSTCTLCAYALGLAAGKREGIDERDALTRRVAERDAKLASLRDWLDSVGDDWTADGLRMFIRDLITDVIDASQAPRKEGET
jgi:hypothetical protein